MSTDKKVRWLIIITSGLFLFIDQLLKWQAAHSWHKAKKLLPYFGWEPYLNYGAAFGLPLSNRLIIVLTLPIIGLVIFLLIKGGQRPRVFLCWSLILAGAVSNLFDRFYRHCVIDYFALATGIINIGDIMIAAGLGLYLLTSKTKRLK